MLLNLFIFSFKMKLFFKKLIFFIPFSIAIYFLLILVSGTILPKSFRINLNYPKAGYGHLFSRINDANKLEKIDLLILGSSTAYRGYDTRIIDSVLRIKSFNLGSSGQTPIQTNYLLKKYLDKLNPTQIIYDAYPGVFFADGTESTTDLIANDNLNINMLFLLQENFNIKTINELIFKIWEYFLGWDKDIKENEFKNSDFYVKGGGYVELIKNIRKKNDLTELGDINQKQLEYFHRNIALIKSKNIDLIIVVPPINTNLYRRIDKIISVSSIIDSSLILFDYNSVGEIITFRDELFYDSHHLNQKGVEIFNRVLIQDMNEMKRESAFSTN